MRLEPFANHEVHLTYCTNIHPGESWPEVEQNLKAHVTAVKASVCPEAPFGVGLRLSNQAAISLSNPSTLARLRAWLDEQGLYVFTLNGFPFGAFHGAPVKEAVYRPDWLEPERGRYTEALAGVLAGLLPDSVSGGSISTVPGCFRPRADADAPARIAAALREQVTGLARMRQNGGPRLTLALEPEPHCIWETTLEAIDFINQHMLSTEGVCAHQRLAGVGHAQAEADLREHLGLCLDACHAAVEFESAAQAVHLAAAHGIKIAKLQVSAGLQVEQPSAAARAALQGFAEGVYLHQTVIRRGDEITRYLDLPQALADRPPAEVGEEWRVHFHVPLFEPAWPPLASTRAFTQDLLTLQARAPFTQHLEVETYTWDVLPPQWRREPVDQAIARELQWTIETLRGAARG